MSYEKWMEARKDSYTLTCKQEVVASNPGQIINQGPKIVLKETVCCVGAASE